MSFMSHNAAMYGETSSHERSMEEGGKRLETSMILVQFVKLYGITKADAGLRYNVHWQVKIFTI
jgi:hypothetical protein